MIKAEKLFWERFRPTSFIQEKGQIPMILLPRIRKIIEKGVILNMMFEGSTGLGKCVDGETLVKVRNKETGEIKEITIKELL